MFYPGRCCEIVPTRRCVCVLYVCACRIGSAGLTVELAGGAGGVTPARMNTTGAEGQVSQNPPCAVGTEGVLCTPCAKGYYNPDLNAGADSCMPCGRSTHTYINLSLCIYMSSRLGLYEFFGSL